MEILMNFTKATNLLISVSQLYSLTKVMWIIIKIDPIKLNNSCLNYGSIFILVYKLP